MRSSEEARRRSASTHTSEQSERKGHRKTVGPRDVSRRDERGVARIPRRSLQPCCCGACEEAVVGHAYVHIRGRPRCCGREKLYALSELPTSLGFFAASAGCRLGMRALLQDSIHFPSAVVCSPVKVTCDAQKKQDSLHTPFK